MNIALKKEMFSVAVECGLPHESAVVLASSYHRLPPPPRRNEVI